MEFTVFNNALVSPGHFIQSPLRLQHCNFAIASAAIGFGVETCCGQHTKCGFTLRISACKPQKPLYWNGNKCTVTGHNIRIHQQNLTLPKMSEWFCAHFAGYTFVDVSIFIRSECELHFGWVCKVRMKNDADRNFILNMTVLRKVIKLSTTLNQSYLWLHRKWKKYIAIASRKFLLLNGSLRNNDNGITTSWQPLKVVSPGSTSILILTPMVKLHTPHIHIFLHTIQTVPGGRASIHRRVYLRFRANIQSVHVYSLFCTIQVYIYCVSVFDSIRRHSRPRQRKQHFPHRQHPKNKFSHSMKWF